MTQAKDHSLTWKPGDQPVSDLFEDMFYSPDNGQAEAAYVFLDGNGLPARWSGVPNFSIAELGFGTGLNFLETWRQWIATRSPNQHLVFTSFEGYPLDPEDMVRALQPWELLQDLSAALVAKWCARSEVGSQWQMDAQTELHVVPGAAEKSVAGWVRLADAWYLDGFAPSKNSDMWSEALLGEVFAHTTAGGSFATYTAAGWVRRNLKSAGFDVSKRDGFAGKREMLVGCKSAP